MLLCPILTHSHGVVGGGRQEQLALAAQLAETAGVREIEAGAATGLHRLLEGLRMRLLLALGAQERLVHLRIGIVLLRGAPRTAHPELELEGRHGRRLGVHLLLLCRWLMVTFLLRLLFYSNGHWMLRQT